MTLIELICTYRDLVFQHGRRAGQDFLEGTCDESLWDHIENSVSDAGYFIDAEGNQYYPMIQP